MPETLAYSGYSSNMDLTSSGHRSLLFEDNVDQDQKDGTCIPHLGMRFKTFDDALNYYKQYASHAGFRAIILKSSYLKSGLCRRLVLGCKRAGNARVNACYLAREKLKINCPARISLKLRTDRWLHIDNIILDHNHPLSRLRVHQFDKANEVKCSESIGSSGRKGRRGYPVLGKDHNNYAELGHLKFGEGDDIFIHKFFAAMQNKIPNFFYLVDLEKDGRLKNIFWADAQSRAAYEYFGLDVAYFDTTYVTEKYDLPLVFFTGVNNHGMLVLFACGLLSDQCKESYTWLFRSFSMCMHGRHPDALITESCPLIQQAVVEVFPQARHRVCLSRVIKSIPEYLTGCMEVKIIKKALKKVIFGSLSDYEFEEEWKKVVEEKGLAKNECLSSLYEKRHLWAPTYLKDKFWAGMSISQRGESAVSFFDGFVYPSTSLKQFFSKYENILENKYKKEEQADMESSHRNPLTVTKFYMEEQIAKVYTHNMFRHFQDELKATMYCDALLLRADGALVTFEVSECSYMEDGKKTEHGVFEVYFRKDEQLVECICGSFQFTGILCRHALSMFKWREEYEIPSRYVLDRWRKDYKRLHSLANFVDEVFVGNVLERPNSVFTSCLQLIKFAFLSDGKYIVALKFLKDAEESLLDEASYRAGQASLLTFETQSSGGGGALLPHYSDSTEASQFMVRKRRGQPLKKVRDSRIEPSIHPNTQDFLTSSFVANENNMFQSASSSHLESHIGQGGIDLMEDITTNDFSFDTRFGLGVSNQHQVVSQSRILSASFMQAHQEQPMMGQSRMQMLYQILQDNPALKTNNPRPR